MGIGRNEGLNDGFVRFNGANAVGGVALDAVFACNGGILGVGGVNALNCNRTGLQLSTAWSAVAAIEHYWTPAFRTSLYGSYARWDPGAGNATMCASPLGVVRSSGGVGNPNGAFGANAGGAVPLAGCDYGFNTWGIGARAIWNPVRNLDVGVEVLYQKLNGNMDPGLLVYTFGGSGTRAAGAYTPSNQDAVVGMFRLQRNFYP
jgi:hypothetical protein